MGGTLYGTASGGGANGNGTIFSINVDGTDFQPFYPFTVDDPINGNFDGATPTAGLLAYQGVLYGTASIGGPVYYTGYGTVFQINPDGSGFEPLDYFDNVTTATDGSYPQNNLILGGNALYGLTPYGGFYDEGGIFKVNLDGTGFSLLHSFDYVDGELPNGGLQLIGNTLYGMTTQGGGHGYGTVFSLQTDGTGFTNFYSFTGGVDGAYPYGGLTLVSNVFYGTTSAGGTNSLGSIFCIGPDGSGFRSLHAFDFADGSSPQAGLTYGGGTLYGETYGGGNGVGTLFKIQADGTGFAPVRAFSLITGLGPAGEGANPEGALLLDGGTLYGTTYAGGENHSGNIFKINTDGSGYVTLWNSDPRPAAIPIPISTAPTRSANWCSWADTDAVGQRGRQHRLRHVVRRQHQCECRRRLHQPFEPG